jgi:hypothetical protein
MFTRKVDSSSKHPVGNRTGTLQMRTQPVVILYRTMYAMPCHAATAKDPPSSQRHQCRPHMRVELLYGRQCSTRHQSHNCEPTKRRLLRYCIAVTSRGAVSRRVRQTMERCLHSRASNGLWVTWQVMVSPLQDSTHGKVSRTCQELTASRVSPPPS